MDLLFDWYNEHRPHMTLGGQTPDEVLQAVPGVSSPAD
jgi:hypothetical protein